MKDNHFKLSSSFQSTFIHNTDKSKQKSHKSTSKQKQLFRLNPKSGSTLDNVQTEILRKNSKKKLESLKDSNQGSKDWSILNKNENESHKDLKQEKSLGKTYNFGPDKSSGRRKSLQPLLVQSKPKEDLPYDIVRPSKLVNAEQLFDDQYPTSRLPPTIFQTPLLPCFQSEFNRLEAKPEQNKKIHEKEGIWKIGKIKITKKNNKITSSTLSINGIEFQANMAEAEGKMLSILGTNAYELRDWKGFWVVEPKQQLFNIYNA